MKGEKVRRTMQQPVFHPCVRLARWREHGELSFVPPDGRFVLAGYEVDLLDDATAISPLDAKASALNLPASVQMQTGLGNTGTEFEVTLSLNPRFSSGISGNAATAAIASATRAGSNFSSAASASLSNHLNRPTAGALRSLSGGNGGDTKSPILEEVKVSIPVPPSVRRISDLRPTRGEAHWNPGDTTVEWRFTAKEAAAIGSAGATLRCSVVGASSLDEDADDGDNAAGLGNGIVKADTYDYDEDTPGTGAYQSASASSSSLSGAAAVKSTAAAAGRDAKKVLQNATLMPTSAALSFSVKGWLASGLKVDSLTIDNKRSKGLGEGVRPYKGVKYLTVSSGGVEIRC